MSLTFADLRPLTRDLPPVAMLCTSDTPGAGGAAMELNTALAAAGLAVTMYVMKKSSNRAGILEVEQGEKLNIAYMAMAEMFLRKYPKRPTHFEMFSMCQKPIGVLLPRALQQVGIVHLHWIAGMIGFPKSVDALRNQPVVWTLHDMNPLSGGCHYTAGCGRYADGGCKACPQLGEATVSVDIAAQSFSAKQAGYAAMNMTVISPGAWQLDCMKKSILLGNVPRIKIPNSVDPYVFSPRPRAWARAAIGLPLNRKVIAFGASSLKRWNKGAQLLKLALEALRSEWQDTLPMLLFFGYGDTPDSLPDGYEYVILGKSTQAELAVAYSAADIFVSASLQETFGLVTAEAQACGTPAVGFYGTGAEDIIQNGVTGYLAAHPGFPLTKDGTLRALEEFFTQETVSDLAEKIQIILTLPDKQAAIMRKKCRKNALQNFSPILSAARHLRLYRRMLDLPEVHIEGLSE